MGPADWQTPFWRIKEKPPLSKGKGRCRLSKNSLAPSGRGLRPQAVGERASRRHEGFGQRRGSLPPALRATAPPLAQAPPPPYRGSLSPRGRFFDTQKPPLSKGGGRRRRPEGVRWALPYCLLRLQPGKNPSASLCSAPPFNKGGKNPPAVRRGDTLFISPRVPRKPRTRS